MCVYACMLYMNIYMHSQYHGNMSRLSRTDLPPHTSSAAGSAGRRRPSSRKTTETCLKGEERQNRTQKRDFQCLNMYTHQDTLTDREGIR